MAVQIIPAQTGTAFTLKAGQKIKIIDPSGEQVADLFCADAGNTEDSFSSGRTIDYNESIYIKPNHFLYAHSGNPLLEIIEDNSPGCHDLLVTPCSLQMFQMINKNSADHPSCLSNLIQTLKEFGLSKAQITSTFNVFMNIKLSDSGHIEIKPPKTKALDFIVLKACRDLVVGLTACSDEGTNNGKCKPIEFEIY